MTLQDIDMITFGHGCTNIHSVVQITSFEKHQNPLEMTKRILVFIALIIILTLGYFYFSIYPKLPIMTGYAAKKMCSCTFISDRDQHQIQDHDLALSPLNQTKTTINRTALSATSSVFGLASKTAVYRKDVGCILLQGEDDFDVSLEVTRQINPDTLSWPYGTRQSQERTHGVRYADVDRLIQNEINNTDGIPVPSTRAIVVVHKDTIIGEGYADGYNADTPQLGWSMTKSITNALIGILAKKGLIDTKDNHLFTAWADDDRKNITIDNLLKMQSGLKFDEEYTGVSDATRMLYLTEDVVSVARDQPLIHPIGSHWSYSSGTSNLLSGIIRNKFRDHQSYLRLPYEELFNPLGMTSAVMETDESGNYIGSSYCYATPRDWAKFGLLYLHDGIWNGQRILPEGWVTYTQEVAPHSEGIYGAHFWKNEQGAKYPDAPHDLYSCNGYQGQYVFIIPSKDLVIVRMGLSKEMDFNGFIAGVVEVIDKSEEGN